MWYLYIIECDNAQVYTGITTDIQRRWQQHCTGKAGARFFRTCNPLRVCYLEQQPDRSAASKREAWIKKLTRPQKLSLIAEGSPHPLPELTPLDCEA